jgi:hypothetical protein
MVTALEGVRDQRHAPAALYPGKDMAPLYRRLGGPLGRSEQVRKISPPPGFDPRTVQPVAISYTDCAIPAHKEYTITRTNTALKIIYNIAPINPST